MENIRFEFKSITATEAAERMEKWKNNHKEYLEEQLDPDAAALRQEIVKAFDENYSPQKYKTDLNFGFALYKILNKYGFTIYDAAKDGVWRYLSLCVAPDKVAKRWGISADVRYYKKNNRIYFKTLWRYIFLSWQGSYEETYKVLEKNTTDQILNLVDRAGRKGYYYDLYRRIMYLFYCAKQKDSSVGDSEFRKIMNLHTALCVNVEPEFYDNGIDGYARMLFKRHNIKL